MYNITEEQIKDIASGGGKSKIKQMFPQVFETKLEVGKWYKHSKLPTIFCLTSFTTAAYGYGIGNTGKWINHTNEGNSFCAANEFHIKFLVPATAKEVEEALIQEAKKRGFKENAKFTCLDKGECTFGRLGSNDFFFDSKGMYNAGGYIFKEGKWAEILPEPTVITKTEAENRLQDLTGEKFKITSDSGGICPQGK